MGGLDWADDDLILQAVIHPRITPARAAELGDAQQVMMFTILIPRVTSTLLWVLSTKAHYCCCLTTAAAFTSSTPHRVVVHPPRACLCCCRSTTPVGGYLHPSPAIAQHALALISAGLLAGLRDTVPAASIVEAPRHITAAGELVYACH